MNKSLTVLVKLNKQKRMKRFKHPFFINTSEVSKYIIIMTVGKKGVTLTVGLKKILL